MKTFSIRESFKFGWNITKKNLWYLVGLFLFVFILCAGSSRLAPLSILVGMFTSISLITVALKLHDGKKIETDDYYSKYNLVLSYLVASVMYVLLVVVGLILLVVPGIYFALKYQFFKFMIIDNGITNPLEALRESGKITEGNMWKLFRLLILTIGFNILGALILGVGLLVTVPTTLLAYTYIYRKLLAQTLN